MISSEKNAFILSRIQLSSFRRKYKMYRENNWKFMMCKENNWKFIDSRCCLEVTEISLHPFPNNFFIKIQCAKETLLGKKECVNLSAKLVHTFLRNAKLLHWLIEGVIIVYQRAYRHREVPFPHLRCSYWCYARGMWLQSRRDGAVLRISGHFRATQVLGIIKHPHPSPSPAWYHCFYGWCPWSVSIISSPNSQDLLKVPLDCWIETMTQFLFPIHIEQASQGTRGGQLANWARRGGGVVLVFFCFVFSIRA